MNFLEQNPATKMIETNGTSEIMANNLAEKSHTPSQTYLSTRGGDYGVIISI